MHIITFLATLLAIANGSLYHGVTVGITPNAHPVQSQYYTQDSHGQYAYGYTTPTATKSEFKTSDGVTHGKYTYIDSNGVLQCVSYVADAVNGFRVTGISNLPQDLPDVAYEKAKHLANVQAIKSKHDAVRGFAYANEVVPIADIHQHQQAVRDLNEVSFSHDKYFVQAIVCSLVPKHIDDIPYIIKSEHFADLESIKDLIRYCQGGKYLPH